MSNLAAKDINNLTSGIKVSPDGVDDYGYLKQNFGQVLSNAKNNFMQYGEGYSDYALTSQIDASGNAKIVVDGGDKNDTLLIDNYRIKNINDINIDPSVFKDQNENPVNGYKITIKGMDGKTHSYNVVNIETLKFLDEAGNIQTVDIKNSLKGTTDGTKPRPDNAGYYTDLKPVYGIGYFGDKNDVGELDGKGTSFNTGKGNDTVRVNSLGKAENPDQVNGGQGTDTIEFMNLTEADISSISYNEKSANYTLTDMNGGVVQFKRFEKIKLGDNTYNITRDGTGLKLEERFKDGAVHLGAGDSGRLSGNGLRLASGDDKIVIDTINALPNTAKKAANFNGSGGQDVLDLTKLGNVKIENFSKSSDVYTLKLDIDGQKRVVNVKNMEILKLASGDLKISEADLKKALGTTDPSAAKNTITVGSDDWKTQNNSSSNLTIKSGATGQTDILKIEGKVTDYSFEFNAGDATGTEDDSVVVTRNSDGKQVQIKAMDAVEFAGEVAGKNTFRLLNNEGTKFGDTDLSNDKSYRVMTFSDGLEGEADVLNGNNIYYGTTSSDNIKAGSGDDVFFEGDNDDNVTDMLDGGKGTDTFVASFPENAYNIKKEDEYFVLTPKDGNTEVIKLKNIENIRFTDEKGNVSDAKLLEKLLEKSPQTT